MVVRTFFKSADKLPKIAASHDIAYSQIESRGVFKGQA